MGSVNDTQVMKVGELPKSEEDNGFDTEAIAELIFEALLKNKNEWHAITAKGVKEARLSQHAGMHYTPLEMTRVDGVLYARWVE